MKRKQKKPETVKAQPWNEVFPLKAKADGKQIGRPKLTKESLPDSFYRGLALYRRAEITKTEFSRMINVSRPTLDKYLEVVEG